jgi:sporulation protein YhbH
MGQDHSRFRKIVKGKIRKNLKQYISKGELIGRKGKDKVSIPVPHINIPRFRFDDQQKGGVGQGDGEVGDRLGPGQRKPGSGEAGEGQGDHILEVDVSIDELAEILGEELGLPNIEPRGDKNIEETRLKYTGIRQTGPEGLKHFKRTYKEAIKRQVISGDYDPDNPVVLPYTSDKRFKSFKPIEEPKAQAVILYMMDVSGSMGDEQKEIVRSIAFWIDTWLQKQYKGLETRFIIHDSVAKEVDRETFFTTRESGGTMISSAFKLCKSIIEADYSPHEWNIYPFYFSDGDNWGGGDTEACIKMLQEFLLPVSNMVAYGQVDSPHGSGQFMEDLRVSFRDESYDANLVLAEMSDKDDIMDAIKTFLGKGH